MKKLLAIIILGLGLFVSGALAQHRDNGRHEGWRKQQERGRRYEQRPIYQDYSRIEVRNEYRYVRYGSVVYREVYRTTYRLSRYGREQVLSRVLIRRERYGDYYDRYGRPRSGLSFNIFFRF